VGPRCFIKPGLPIRRAAKRSSRADDSLTPPVRGFSRLAKLVEIGGLIATSKSSPQWQNLAE
jgi:hypothetical protein